jgi:hypothetical protein
MTIGVFVIIRCKQGGRHGCGNDIDVESRKLRHDIGPTLVLSLHGAPLDDVIPSLDIAELMHALPECI